VRAQHTPVTAQRLTDVASQHPWVKMTFIVVWLRPRSHDTGMKFCRQKIVTVSTVHTIPADYIPLWQYAAQISVFFKDSSVVGQKCQRAHQGRS
jgi:hypothetical protein